MLISLKDKFTIEQKEAEKLFSEHIETQRELDSLPQLIESLDAEQAQLQETMNAAGFYQQDPDPGPVRRPEGRNKSKQSP